MKTAILGLKNYVRNSKVRFLIAVRTIKKMKINKHQMSTKREKRIKGKHRGHKNNYMDNLSGKK